MIVTPLGFGKGKHLIECIYLFWTLTKHLMAALLVRIIQHCHLLASILKTLFWVGLKYINYWKQSKRLAWNELTKLNSPLLSKSQHIYSQHSSVKTKLRDNDPASEGFLNLTDKQNEHETSYKCWSFAQNSMHQSRNQEKIITPLWCKSVILFYCTDIVYTDLPLRLILKLTQGKSSTAVPQ